MLRGIGGEDEARRHGTVGAVARDSAGNLAAATSTGGMTGKAPGRIGDCPVFGAGTYADNRTCAVSATGHGEYFIRHVAAHDIAARSPMPASLWNNMPPWRSLPPLAAAGGTGGVVAVDHNGAIALPFSTPGMYRGYVRGDGVVHTAIFATGARRGLSIVASGHAAAALAAFLLLAVAPAALAQTKPAISDGIVKIGAILDMTGPYADNTGVGSVAAAHMAIEDFGGKVLGAPIELRSPPTTQSSTDHAADIARDWYEHQHVDAILDVSGSSEALIVQAIGRARDKIVSLSAPGAERLTNEACSPTGIHYAFDTYSIAHSSAPPLIKAGGNTWFFVTADYSFGYDLEADTTAAVKAAGGTVLGHARHPLDAPDFHLPTRRRPRQVGRQGHRARQCRHRHDQHDPRRRRPAHDPRESRRSSG